MASSYEKYQKKRLISSYFSVVVSVFLVLFLLGILGLFVIYSQKLSDDFKEQIPMSIYFRDQANDSILKAFDKELRTSKFVKDYVFVPKELAAETHKDVIGEDFMTFLGTNPLQNSFDVHLNATFVVADSIKKIEKEIRSNLMVADLIYDKHLVDMVNDNVKKITFWILVVCGIFAVIAVLLINSSMRLSIYSNRFIIKTMQMVGATKAFIRKPFIIRSVMLGVIGSLLAIISIIGVLYYVDDNLPQLGIFQDWIVIGSVLAGVLVAGILISWFSTFFATQKFLNLRTDDLY